MSKLSVEEMREKLKERKFDKSKDYAFVSYSSVDSEKVYECVLNLVEQGANIWIDVELKKSVGKDWKSTVLNTIDVKNCKYLLLFVSKTSLGSTPVAAEVYFANNITNRPNIIPVVIPSIEGKFIDWCHEVVDDSDIPDKNEQKIINTAHELSGLDGKSPILMNRGRVLKVIEDNAFSDGEDTIRTISEDPITIATNIPEAIVFEKNKQLEDSYSDIKEIIKNSRSEYITIDGESYSKIGNGWWMSEENTRNPIYYYDNEKVYKYVFSKAVEGTKGYEYDMYVHTEDKNMVVIYDHEEYEDVFTYQLDEGCWTTDQELEIEWDEEFKECWEC